MADDKKPDHYWRDVFKGAWDNSLHRVGWDSTKAVLATAAFIGSWILGGVVFSATGGFLIGIAILAPVIFLWGVVQTQAKMYCDLAKQQSTPAINAPIEPERKRRAPDFDKWRHVEILELGKAAQLWEGEVPGLAIKGPAAETYEMLRAAVSKGELGFIPTGYSLGQRADDSLQQAERRNPNTFTRVTRPGLQKFAATYGYDPEFLRDPQRAPMS